MTRSKDNPIVLLISRMVSPFIMLFALYVIFHGHYSPGGGFQGGTMLAASLILIRLTAGTEIAQLQFKKSWGIILGSIGVLIYFSTGLVAMLLGGNFLDYKFLRRESVAVRIVNSRIERDKNIIGPSLHGTGCS